MKKHIFLLPLAALTPTLTASFAVAAPAISTTEPVSAEEPVAAEEEETVITVTATRNPRLLSETPSSVTVITRAQLQAGNVFDLSEAIRRAPGVSLSQSGTRGKSSSLFMRGTESNHTLVLIDGIRANNPDDGRFDFGVIPAENIERIEVMRGPGSALYGSDAIGGVINIITRQGAGPLRSGGKVEVGNFATNKQVFSLNGQLGKSRLSLAASRLDSDGSFANDAYTNNGISLRVDRELTPESRLTFLSRLSHSKAGVPGQRFLSPDPFQSERTSDFNTSLQWNQKRGTRQDQISLGLNDRYLRDDDTQDTQFNSPFFFTAKNRVRSLEGKSAWTLGQHTLTAGLENRREASESTFFGSRATDTNAIYVQDEWKNGRLLLVPGLRHEENSQYEGYTSGRLAAAYNLNPTTRVKGTYGTGFKAPTFLDLFAFGGNPNLTPEKSRGAELGLEKRFGGGGRAEATFFRNDVRNLIAYDNAAKQSINVAQARTQGLELSLDQPIGKGTRLILGQTFTQIKSASAAARTRRPKYNTTANLISQQGRWNLDLGFLAQGKRQDADFVNEFALREYPSHYRFDLSVGYALKPGIEVYGRAQNLLNKSYAEVAGYPAPRFNLVFGVKTAAF